MPAQCTAPDVYHERIVRAEAWAGERIREARAYARASFHVPANRKARYRDLEPWFIDRLSESRCARIERALQVVLEAVETDVYGLPREPVPDDLAVLVAEGLAACGS